MAAITSAAIVAAGSAYAANRQASGAKDAARAQQQGADAATAEQRRQFDLSMEMTAPRRQIEGQALEELAMLTGLRGNRTAAVDPATGQPMESGAPDYSNFFMSPDYQFALEQGEQSAMRGASAMGNLRSGNTLAALTKYGQGMASQQFGRYISRLQGLAGMGATEAGADRTLQHGQQVGNNMMAGANARASGIAGQANAWSGFGNQMAQLGGYAMQQYGSAPKMSPMIQGANTTYQQPPTGYYSGNNMMRVA